MSSKRLGPSERQALREKWNLIDFMREETGATGERDGRWTMFFCPFHDDGKTPRFGVNPDGMRWMCFSGGCGSGDVVDLVMRLKGWSFPKTVEYLGNGHAEDDEVARAERERRRQKREAEAKQRELKIAHHRSMFQARKPWLAYNRALGPAQRAWWRAQGIPDSWQDGLLLGFRYKLWNFGSAYTIPFFELGGKEVRTLQYRLAKPVGKRKYSFEPDLGSAAYIVRPDLPLDLVIVVEGAKKAIVTHILGTGEKMQVVGFPSLVSDGGILPRLREAGRVYLIPDPGAFEKWLRFGAEIGSAARMVLFGRKIDDALVSGELDRSGLRSLLRGSTKVPCV